MKHREFRICMPLTLAEYEVGFAWCFDEQSRRETNEAGEGVEIVKNVAFKKPLVLDSGRKLDGGGQYTYKIYHAESKLEARLPACLSHLIESAVGKSRLELHEESWNCFPYFRTELTNPGYMGRDFRLVVETLHKNGSRPEVNALEMAQDVYDKFKLRTLDIVSDPAPDSGFGGDGDDDVLPADFRSAKTGRGPLRPDTWREDVGEENTMTVYKFVSVHFNWFGLETKMEHWILDELLSANLAFHQRIWCWLDHWHGLTLQEVRRREHETQKELEQRRARPRED